MRKYIVALLAGLLSTSTASALVIKNDPGGNLGARFEKIHALLESGEEVRLVGECLSSCTLILRLPPSQICATKNAKLGFHAMMQAARSGSDEPKMVRGKPVLASPERQEKYMDGFAENVKTWLRQSGALTSVEMTYVPATKFMRSCDEAESAELQYQPTLMSPTRIRGVEERKLGIAPAARVKRNSMGE